jgi:hypothetical protein
MSTHYTNIFHWKTLQNLPKLGFLSCNPAFVRFFLVQTYQNGKSIPNNRKLYKTINYTKWP